LEAIYMLQLQIPDEVHPSVESALRFYGREHQLGDEARCEECQVPGRRTRTESVLRWPSVLTLGIQRQDDAEQKLFTALDFNLTLNVNDGITYDLRGVVVHEGHSVRSGHYIAYVCGRGGKWFRCNDACTPQEVSVADVLSVQAYTLFYEKR
jgi:ubiquitin C-terminal hydrolase